MTRTTVVAPVALVLLLQACATTAPVAQPDTATSAPAPAAVAPAPAPVATPADVPELKLNMPHNNCVCDSPPKKADYTFLEKGYESLLDGEYKDAMQHFERYQRLESSPRADLEAGIAIAYVQMLPRSSFYDPEAARRDFKVLRQQNAKKLKVHEYTRLMRQSLLNLLELQGRIDDLKRDNSVLQEDLKKREEALKRLRDLTLGQKGSPQ